MNLAYKTCQIDDHAVFSDDSLCAWIHTLFGYRWVRVIPQSFINKMLYKSSESAPMFLELYEKDEFINTTKRVLLAKY
jgi:hypothetical protein